MIARRTLVSLLLVLLLPLAVALWKHAHPDDCDRLAGTFAAGTGAEFVQSGDHLVAVSCHDWIDRQPIGVLASLLAEAVLTLIFINACVDDLRRNRARKLNAAFPEGQW